MKIYTNSSNARRAAKTTVDKYPALLEVATPVRADSLTPAWYPAVSIKPGYKDDLPAELAETVKVVDSQDDDEPEEGPTKAPETPAKAPRAKKATVAAKPKAKPPARPAKAPLPRGRKSPAGSRVGEQVLALIAEKGGATSGSLQAKFDWAPHTLRGFISTTNKKARAAGTPEIITERADKVTTYSMGA